MGDPKIEETRALYRALLARRIFVVSGILALVLTLSVILYAVVAIRSAQVTNTGTLNASNRTLRLFIDCTSTKGQCYQRNERRTGALAGALDEGTRAAAAAAAACAARPDISGYVEIKACVDRTLASQRKKK